MVRKTSLKNCSSLIRCRSAGPTQCCTAGGTRFWAPSWPQGNTRPRNECCKPEQEYFDQKGTKMATTKLKKGIEPVG